MKSKYILIVAALLATIGAAIYLFTSFNSYETLEIEDVDYSCLDSYVVTDSVITGIALSIESESRDIPSGATWRLQHDDHTLTLSILSKDNRLLYKVSRVSTSKLSVYKLPYTDGSYYYTCSDDDSTDYLYLFYRKSKNPFRSSGYDIQVSKDFASIPVLDFISSGGVSTDSIEASTTIAGSYVSVTINSDSRKQALDSCANKVSVIKEEFDDYSWVEPKARPRYRNQSGLYCYFKIQDDYTPSNLRFVYQYAAEDWLFIEKMVFNIDGTNYTIYPDMETDHGYLTSGDVGIWEWCDESTIKSSVYDVVSHLATASSAKVKLIGNQYYAVRNINQSQLSSIRDIWNLYKDMGGNITRPD